MKLLLTFALLLLSLYTKAQVGTEFWFAAPDVLEDHEDDPVLIRITALDEAANVTISLPAAGKTYETITVGANSMSSIEFTHDGETYNLDDIENTPANTVNQKGILISSTADITVYYDVASSKNPDRFTLKGENALGTEFYISSQYDFQNTSDYDDEAVEQINIVATEDNTKIEITPTAAVIGHAANTSFSISLDRGESYCVKGNSIAKAYTLSGTHITSDKDIAVTLSDESVYDDGTTTTTNSAGVYDLITYAGGGGSNGGGSNGGGNNGGNNSSNSGSSSSAKDLIGDQTVPVAICGTEYIAMFSGEEGSGSAQKVYILATEDNTVVVVDFDNNVVGNYTIEKAGDSESIDIEDASAVHITSSSPVYVYQVSGLLNGSSNELGSAILPPISCTGSTSVTFTQVLTYGFYVQVLAQYKNINYFTFSGGSNLLDLSENKWTVVPGTDTGDADDTWYFTNQSISLTTGTPYTLTNSNGLFHLSVFDENSNSASFGYFSAFNSLAIHGVTEACQGDYVTLTASESLGSYEWYSEATEDTILSTVDSLIVDESGKYWVTATRTVYNETCTLADTIDVDFEVPEFSVNYDQQICLTDTIIIIPQFDENSDEDYTFLWSHGSDEDVSTDSIYAFIPTVSDTIIDVYLTVFNEDSCSTTDTISVTVLPEADIDFDIDITNASLCYGSILSDTIEAVSYAWTKGSSSGEVIDTTSSITVYDDGWYYLTVSNGACSTTDSVEVSIIDLPEITLNDSTLCQEAYYTSPTYTDAYTYEWTTKYSDYTSDSTSFYLPESESDSLFVTFTDTLTGCSNSDTAYIKFWDKTEISSAKVPICAYSDYTFTASSKIVGSYVWSSVINSEDSVYSVTTNTFALTNILPSQAGTYTVTGVDVNGCEVSQDFVLTVSVGTSFDIEDEEICKGESVDLDVDGVVTASSFQWYYNNPAVYDTATVFSTSKKITVDTEGTYYVMAVKTSSSNGCSSLDSVNVTVHDLPEISLDDISAQCQSTSYTYDAGYGFKTYKWQNNSTNQTYTATKPQTIYVTVTDENGCSNADTTTFAWKEVNVIDDDTIVVCPETSYTIELEDNLTNITWSFYDNYSSAVSHLDNNTSSSYEIASVDTLDAGLYIIKATEDGCAVVDTTNLFVVSTASINLGDDRSVCSGDKIQLNVNEDFVSYEWYLNNLTNLYYDNDTTSYVLAGGSGEDDETWYVIATYYNADENTTCILESSVDVIKKLLPELTLKDVIQPCTYDTVPVSEIIEEAYSNSGDVDTLGYYWNGSNSSSSLEDLYISESGTYTLKVSNTNLIYEDGIVTDTLYCYASDTTEADYRELFSMDLSDQLICPEETTTLDAPTDVTSYSELENYQWVYLDDNGNAVDSCDANTSWQNISSAKAGNYVLKVQYTDSLCLSVDTMEVVVKESPSVTIYGDTVIFEGETTTLSTDYGFQSYLWSTGATVESIDVTDEGYYIVTVVALNDCQNSDTTQVIVLDLPSFADVSLNDSILCHDDTYTSPDYGDSFEFTWSTKVSGITSHKSSITLTQTDSLYLTITDPTTGYTKSDSAYIYFRPETTVATKTYTLCAYTDYTFTASSLIVGDYAWSFEGTDLNNSTSSYTLTNILRSDAGTYTVTGVDQYGCSVTQDFILNVTVGTAIDFGSDKEICEGDSVQLSANVSASSYLWYYNENPEVTQDGTAISSTQKYYVSKAGTYYAMAVSTSNGCASVDSVKVIVHDLPTVSLDDVSALCQSSSYTYNAGSGFSSYEWKDGSTSQTYTAEYPQTVSVTVTDENGCINADTTQFTWKEVHVIDDDTIVVCPETAYTIELEDGLSDISWTFNDNYGSSTDLNNSTSSYYISSVDTLDAGTYIIEATEDGCEVLDTTALFVVATASINLGADRTICNGETIQLNANEGFVSYAWYCDDLTKLLYTTASVTAGSSSEESTEAWTVIAVYDNGTNSCTLESSVDVEKKLLPDLTLKDLVKPCTNDTVTLSEIIVEAYSNSGDVDTLGYYWNGSSKSSALEDISITESGTYTLTVSNTNITTDGDILYCYASDTTEVDYRELFTMSSLSDKLLCPGETTTLVAPDDVTSYSELENYQWVHLDDDGNVDSSSAENTSWSGVSAAGNYVLRMEYTDSLCFDSDTLAIVTKELPDVAISGDTVICSGDTTTLSADYGYKSYLWSTGETTESVDVTDAGDYVLTITGQNSCENSDTTTLVVNELPLITLTDDNPGLCDNSSISISVANVKYSDGSLVSNLTYEWSTWDTTSSINVSSDGDYSVSVTDANGCSNSDTVTVFDYPVTTIDLSGIETTGCSNEGVLLECPLSLSDITSYQWSKIGGSTDTPSENTDWTVHESGIYVLSVVDANLCEVSDSVTIEIYTSPTLELGSDKSVCISTSYELTSSGDFASYLWSTGETTSSISISELGEADYWLQVKDALGCSVSDTITITTKQKPSVYLAQPDTVCTETQVELTPEISNTSSYSIWWSTNTSSETITVYGGTYSVTVTDNTNKCSSSDTVTVYNYDSPEVSLGDDQYICPLIDTVYVSPEEGDIFSSYLWHNDEITYEIVGDIDLINRVTVTDVHNCSATDQVVLKYLNYTDTTFNFAMCQQDTTISLLDIDSDADLHTGEYYWYPDGSTEDYYTFTISDTALVSIGITIDNGASTCYYKQDTIIMDFYPLPVITALDTIIYQSVTIEMDNENPPYSYSMDSVTWQSDNTFDDLGNEGEYTVYVIDNNNCTTSQTFTLADDVEITVPEFFTPNNDGYYDTWEIDGIERLPNSIIRIYDRYGKLMRIYKATEEGWDGTYLSKPMPVTDYWYVVELNPLNKLLKGHFTLKR